jgi:hypothetical protein
MTLNDYQDRNPIAEDLFTKESPPRLIGGRNIETGQIVFPCPPGDRFEPYPLRRTGKIWSYTIQRFRPKSPPYAGPEAFIPFAVAYVELAGEVIVEARLANIALADIAIDMPVELTLIPLDPAKPDSPLIHAFQPVGEAS